MSRRRSLPQLERAITRCRECPELRDYCADVGRAKRKAYEAWTYWARPVSGFGDHAAPILIVGLAPAAHGANRTGRIFTGDRSGDFLYAALHRAGLANQAEAVSRDDGLELEDVYITAACRCAPPANKPTAAQLDRCRPWLEREIETLEPRVLFCLGGIGWNAAMKTLAALGRPVPRPRPAFGHGVVVEIGAITVIGCYHVSQQNTFTGRLTEDMIDEVLAHAKDCAAL